MIHPASAVIQGTPAPQPPARYRSWQYQQAHTPPEIYTQNVRAIRLRVLICASKSTRFESIRLVSIFRVGLGFQPGIGSLPQRQSRSFLAFSQYFLIHCHNPRHHSKLPNMRRRRHQHPPSPSPYGTPTAHTEASSFRLRQSARPRVAFPP